MLKYLEKAAQAYYDGEPIISDAEFDYLARVNNYNQLGAVPLREGTIPHHNRLYSLQKYYIGDKVPVYEDPIESPKLDGAAISILYLHGKLYSVATRGDGLIGEDITNNFIDWGGIPQEVRPDLALCQVIGEIVAPKTVENARNYAAGATRLKDPAEFRTRDIQFIAYSVFGFESGTYRDNMTLLEEEGFTTVLEPGLEVIYPTDGKVFRENCSYTYKEEWGFTDKHPKGAYALKDANEFEIVNTKLLEVIWQVGKSGKVTPVAIFEEVIIEDANVSKATLHNAGFIEDMNLRIGDIIVVTRAGGVIPKVLGVYNEH